ncbi:histidine N-alpha-methyltransferase-like [Argopecten irradians]|uniref:histidine N-alpha-methyltransferase-like n=1 Tax=Argopecten irradians TaxID=31199 RepID=UPI00371C5B33
MHAFTDSDELKRRLVIGLESKPKYIPFSYKYDEVGSMLQKDIYEFNDGYYLTASETWILQHHVQDIIPDASNDLTLIDLGSGDCSKTRFVIDELIKRQKTLTFYPLDISGEFLLKVATKLKEEYGDSLTIYPMSSDYKEGIEHLIQIKSTKLILWIGTMFNLSYEDQINTLRLTSTIMTDQCRLEFSADITLSRDAVLKAYDDDGGYKRRFNLNVITRMNREEGSMIDLDKFSYHFDFIHNTHPEFTSYIRAYIEAKEDVQYSIPGLGIDMAMKKGEHFYLHEGTGLSCKYTLEQLQTIVEKAGLRLTGTLIDKENHAVLFNVLLTARLILGRVDVGGNQDQPGKNHRIAVSI